MPEITPKPVKIFDRTNECSKVDLYLCFKQGGRYVRRAVVEARGEIGLNAIKYLIKKEYAVRLEVANVEYWELTEDGKAWLTTGLARHLELHPEQRHLIPGPTAQRVRRTR